MCVRCFSLPKYFLFAAKRTNKSPAINQRPAEYNHQFALSGIESLSVISFVFLSENKIKNKRKNPTEQHVASKTSTTSALQKKSHRLPCDIQLPAPANTSCGGPGRPCSPPGGRPCRPKSRGRWSWSLLLDPRSVQSQLQCRNSHIPVAGHRCQSDSPKTK